MAGLILIEPTELYNILNQKFFFSKLSDPIYIILLDARNKEAYNESHVVTSKRIQMDKKGHYMVPYDANLECKEHVIVYDGNTTDLHLKTPATLAASLLSAKGSRNPVKIVRGGYERFSALYPFLRTQKVLFMPRELDAYEPYPIEVIPGCLYVGTSYQALQSHVQKDLKIKAQINCTMECEDIYGESNADLLTIAVEDKPTANILPHLETVCAFIDSNKESGRTVLIFSERGISRSVVVAMAYLMHSNRMTLRDAWNHLLKCSIFLRPQRVFVEQLSAFEVTLFNEIQTNIDEPNY